MINSSYSIRRIYIQRAIGFCLCGYGFYILFANDNYWGSFFAFVGLGIAGAADRNKWFYFPLTGNGSGASGDSDGCGGGDGGGGGGD